MVGFREERFAMPLRKSPAFDQLDCLIRQLEEPDGVGEVAAASSEPRREPARGQVQVLEQQRDGPGLLTGGRALFERGEYVSGSLLGEPGLGLARRRGGR
jgi:hypothetical protein